MNKSSYNTEITRLATLDEARQRYRLGRTKMMEIAKENGAYRKFGKVVRIDTLVMDKAIENY